MNNLIRTFVIICLLSFFRMPVQAVPAFPGEISYKQPDGTVVKYHLRGDEHRHWMETPGGYLLQKSADGYLMYAEQADGAVKASSVPYAGNDAAAMGKIRLLTAKEARQMAVSPKAVGDPSLSVGSSFPTTGKRKLLMLLVNYANTQTTIPRANFEEMMNAEGYNGTGSFRDFFLDNSYGQLDVETTVVGWIQLQSNKYAYSTEDMTALISEAISIIDGEIDFTEFDNDGDGILDGLSIIHQGYGQEVTGSADDVWSHSGDLLSEIYADGVRVRTYTIQPELLYDMHQMTVGLFCHEFGHNLGAPDFYDTDYESSGGSFTGTGVWDIMSGGSWNQVNLEGDSPSHINMWQKMQFGWVTPQYLTESCSITDMPSASSEPVGYIMNTQREGDYFVLENRVPTGFDRTLPGGGLIIYHADENRISSTVTMNTVNVDYNQGLYTVCASATTDPGTTPGSYGEIDNAGAAFPGTTGASEFSDATTPSAHSNDGKYSYAALRNIQSDGTTVSFDFVKSDVPDTVMNFTASARRGIVTLQWEAPEEGEVVSYRIFRNDELLDETSALQYVDNSLTSIVATYKIDVRYTDGLYSPFVTRTVKVPENRITSITPTTGTGSVSLTWELNTMLTRMNPDIPTAMKNSVITTLRYGTMEVAQLFRKSDLATYVGYSIRSLSFFPFSSQREVSYTLRVYRVGEEGIPEVVSERDASEYGSGQWRTLNLRTPVTIEAGYDYMIGFAVNSSIGSAGLVVDGSTLDPGLGNLVYADGEWHSDLLEGNIFCYATLTPYQPTDGDFIAGEEPVYDPNFNPLTDVAYPIGFNVYRDNEFVGFSSSCIFIDDNAAAGNHTYGIACLYQGNNESSLVEVNAASASVGNMAANDATKVYAADGAIYIESQQDGIATVYTADGKMVARRIVIHAGETTVVNAIQASLYIVKIESNYAISTYKTIVESK